MNRELSNYFKDWEIDIAQCSANSHLKLTELSNICQQTAALHSAAWGMSYFDMQKENQAWVLSTMRFEIFDLPIWHENIQSETWIESLKGMRSVRDFEIKKGDQLVAKASSLWVVLNTEKRRPEPLAIPYDNLEQFPKRKATTIPTSRIDLTKPAVKVADRKVVYSDLDIVGHANNVKYMEWCFDVMNREIFDKNLIQAIDLNYLKEIHFEDIVEIKSFSEGKFIYLYIIRDETICFALRIELKS